jgi:hypothetical protein
LPWHTLCKREQLKDNKVTKQKQNKKRSSMKKQIFLVLFATLTCSQLSHTMQQAAHSAGRSARNRIRRVSTGRSGQAHGEEYVRVTDARTIVRCIETPGSELGIHQCVEETWVPGLLPALLKLAKRQKSPDLFHELKEEYQAGQSNQ